MSVMNDSSLNDIVTNDTTLIGRVNITHYGGGFFASCNTRLNRIIYCFVDLNDCLLLPIVNSSGLFDMYKIDKDKDITYEFFEHYNNIVENILGLDQKYIKYDITDGFQFDNYKDLPYEYLLPFVKKYFTPSGKILDIHYLLIQKYNIDLENLVGIYYRGTDKYLETPLASFESFYNKLNEVLEKENPGMQILVQTDSGQFLDYMKEKCVNNKIIVITENGTSYTNKGIHNEKTNKENYVDMHFLLSTFLILSKSKHLICSSSNCSIWMVYYRGGAENVYQSLDGKWL